MNVAMAKPTEEKLKSRVDLLEVQVADLQAELARVSPEADLTGTTYCLFGQGTWLFADTGVSAEVTANPFLVRLDFTSSTQLTATTIYDPVTHILISSVPPFFAMFDEEDLAPESLTYTLVGNLLTITFFENGESETSRFIMTPDAQTFVGGFFERSGEGNINIWETGMIVAVRAANCDGLIEE